MDCKVRDPGGPTKMELRRIILAQFAAVSPSSSESPCPALPTHAQQLWIYKARGE